MKFFIASCLSILLFTTCKTGPSADSGKAADPQANAGSCRIEATIVRILASNSQDTSDICFKNPCDAIVHLDRIMHCGSAATVTPDENGEIAIHFANSLNSVSNNSQRGSKEGLKAGSHFSALVESRPAIGDKMNYIIYSYETR